SALEFQSPVYALRLATALNWFWRIRGNLYEATNWLERALAAAPFTATTERSAALEALGLVKFDLGDFESALAHLELSRELLRASGHAHGSPATLVSLAKIAATRSDDERARLLARESLDLSRELGDTASAASSLNVLGNVARHRG